MVALNFNATTVDPNTGGGDIFETGEYGFQIVGSSVKQTKAGTGTMLIFDLACIEEGMSGKRLAIRLNVQNPNQQAVEIAMRDLSAICYVTGQLVIQDTQQLHGKPFRVRVEKVPRSDDPTKFGNEVRAYMDMQGNPPSPQGSAAPAAPAAPAAAPAAPAAPTAPGVQQAAPAAPAIDPNAGVIHAAAPVQHITPTVAQPAAVGVGSPAPAPAPAPAAPATAPWLTQQG